MTASLDDVVQRLTLLCARLERLETKPSLDPLTRAYTRTYVENAIAREVQRYHRADRTMRRGECFAIAMLDLDHFKQVNDTHGHSVGDEVLARVVQEIQRHLNRALDVLSRFGGDEFLLFFPMTDGDGAGLVCERIRAAIAALPEHLHGVTVSIGVAVYPTHAPAAASLIRAADRAMYVAKEQRNTVFIPPLVRRWPHGRKFAEVLREARQHNSIAAETVAEMCGISRRTLYQIEEGTSIPRDKRRKLITAIERLTSTKYLERFRHPQDDPAG